MMNAQQLIEESIFKDAIEEGKDLPDIVKTGQRVISVELQEPGRAGELEEMKRFLVTISPRTRGNDLVLELTPNRGGGRPLLVNTTQQEFGKSKFAALDDGWSEVMGKSKAVGGAVFELWFAADNFF